MANRYANLPGAAKIKDTYDRINQGFDLVEQDVDQLRADLDQEIADREAAVEYVDQRVDNIIVGGGPDKDPELVDIRTPDPSYTPGRTINVAGDVTRDMQAQFVTHKAETVSHWANADHYGVIGDGSTDDSAALQAAVDDAIAKGYGTLYIPFPSIRVTTDVDCKGLRVVGNQTNVRGILKNASYFEGVIINGFDYDDTQMDPMIVASSSSPKVLYRASADRYYLITRKFGGKGYLFYWLERGITSASNETNYGAPGDLLRVTTVWNVLDAVVYNHTYKEVGGTWTESNQNLVPDYTGGQAAKFWRNNPAVIGDYIEFEIEVPASGVFNLAFLMTPASSRDVDVEIDGETVDNLDLTGSNALWIKEFRAKPGTRSVRLTTNEARSFFIAGFNYYHLKDADPERLYDSYAYWRNDDHYVSNKGSMDYALVEAETGKYCGSYHGGETAISFNMIADGEEIDPDIGDLAVMTNLTIEQETDIISKLISRTSQRWLGDGVYEFQGQFSGDMNVVTLYTAMTTTDPRFDEIDYPIQKTITDEGYTHMGRRNKIVQRNAATNQKVTTLFTLFNEDNNVLGGLFVNAVDGAYNKVYYGKVRSSYQNIKSLAFTTVRIFE